MLGTWTFNGEIKKTSACCYRGGQQHGCNNRQITGVGGRAGNCSGTSEAESIFQKEDSSADPGQKTGHGGQTVEITAGETQKRPQRASQKNQSTEHHQRSEHKSDERRRTATGAKFTVYFRHDKRADDPAGNFRTGVLQHAGFVQAQRSCDVSQMTRCTESVITGIASLYQQDGPKAKGETGDPNPNRRQHKPLLLLIIAIDKFYHGNN